jgi:hypothetical protein
MSAQGEGDTSIEFVLTFLRLKNTLTQSVRQDFEPYKLSENFELKRKGDRELLGAL